MSNGPTLDALRLMCLFGKPGQCVWFACSDAATELGSDERSARAAIDLLESKGMVRKRWVLLEYWWTVVPPEVDK